MKTLENVSCWTGNNKNYKLYAVKNGKEIDLTQEYVGQIDQYNDGSFERHCGKDLNALKEEYESAYYVDENEHREVIF
jgi:hypothetical protein